jgi:hypothetical protein
MKHYIVAGLLLLSAALAADAKPKSPAGAPPPAAPSKDPKVGLAKAKQALTVAVRLCDVPGRCEAGSRGADAEYVSMLQNAERNFMTACEQCSTAERCDQERERIRSGKRSPDDSPCG